jgi:ketol-acid reductoisomerase
MYVNSVSVSITCSTPGAVIYYTTDGSTPTTASPIYTSAFTLTASATVKAMALATGYTQSGVATATYAITVPTTLYREIFRVFDFELGPHDLPEELANSWNS